MKSIFQNIKTTISGAIAGLPIIVHGIEQKNISLILAGVGALLVGLFAKDSSNAK
jgi:hypothetical protein